VAIVNGKAVIWSNNAASLIRPEALNQFKENGMKARTCGRMGFIAREVTWILLIIACVAAVGSPVAQAATDSNGVFVDLLSRYPTTLTAGDTDPERARQWEFSARDIYALTGFSLSVGDSLKATIGEADVGFGHCSDGAVWVVVIPREKGVVRSAQGKQPEPIDHLWLRFHPAEIGRLFPSSSVKGPGNEKLMARMQKIANLKMSGSWQAGGRAMIPGREDMTVDADTIAGLRRFFMVDTKADTATYVDAFERRTVPQDKPFTSQDAGGSFDKLWDEYDRSYAMFMIRPEVDWDKLRLQYRPKALESATAYEFALVCAEMLKNLRDLHIWITVDEQGVPVFDQPRQSNANPSAFESIVGRLAKADRNISWGKTAEKVGFISINSWKQGGEEAFDEVLENMRNTRGLIIDVRLNGGGDESTAGKVAGRFADKEHVYAYSQFRNGPKHTDLTEKHPRNVKPRGPWRYDRPVVVLIGQKCMSSNESFVSMITQCPQVTTMGDHTCGSSGNPKFVELPGNVKVSLPQWLDLLPDGTPLDERGVAPDVNFPAKAGSFEGTRDDLLTAAVERLNKETLPKEPIPGKSVKIAKADRDTAAPKIVSVWPSNGAMDVDPNTRIRIRFDRPMDPALMAMSWRAGRCDRYISFEYIDKENEFVIGTKLQAGCKHSISLVSDKWIGFRTRSGQAMAHEFEWSFKTRAVDQPGGSAQPQLASVTPTPGSKLSLLDVLQIRFDAPMDPDNSDIYSVTDQDRSTGYQILSRQVEYDATNRTFFVPVVLQPNWKGSIELTGFVSSGGVSAEPVKIEYSSGEQLTSEIISSRLEKAGQSKTLVSMMERLKQARTRLGYASETVLGVSRSNNWLNSYDCRFKMKNNTCFYADISNVMGNPFLIGSDGKECWYYLVHNTSEGQVEKTLIVLPHGEAVEKDVSICDPFGLARLDVDAAMKEFKPEYLGIVSYGGRSYHLIRTWSVEKQSSWNKSYTSCYACRWWIDTEKLQVSKVEYDYGGGEATYTYLYDPTVPGDSVFACPKIAGVEPQKPEPLKKGYDIRFIRVIDGSSNGRASVRWGMKGPAGMSSDGMN
jgi:hypothetical protein